MCRINNFKVFLKRILVLICFLSFLFQLSAVKREPLEEDSVVSEDGSARSSSDVATGGVGNMASAMERHIQQTNERLLCIKEVRQFSFFRFKLLASGLPLILLRLYFV